ncbi:hypothetical protein [Curtobacterium sp. MCBD17_030]|uniref:hypothetical protein n=1 Tax=Curtobacterium sp. MCBD17_030 TaxID=2175649 RepID=UPI000D8D15FD|nr:hypothetical protein [Curtobacterium sp. MCBD17_030]PYY33663.1 hypothetical protein DEI89_09965 [Curtobacterium sp. MCBD17_030]
MTFAEILVEVAVDLSPADHRSVRREQWLADVRDATELDLSPLRLALGALTTAVFHRARHHRSTWGNTMTTTATSRPMIGAVPVLTIAVVLSILLSAAFTLAFGGDHGGGSWQWYRFITIQALFGTVLPAVGVVTMLRVTRVPRTRLAVSTVLLLLGAVAFGGWEIWALLGIIPVDYTYSMAPTFWGLPVLGLALWSWSADVRGWRWLLVAAPVVLWALLLPLAPSLPVASRPGLERLPLLLAVLVAALVAPRAERAGARQSVAVPPGS